MEHSLVSLPNKELKRLDFLIGEGTGIQTLFPPGQPAAEFRATMCGSRESCERFVRVEFFAAIPGFGIETFISLLTYSQSMRQYRHWVFMASQEEPLHMTGDFSTDGKLVMVSDPSHMIWGLERMRWTFTPYEDGGIEYLAELWEPEGYRKYCAGTYCRCS